MKTYRLHSFGGPDSLKSEELPNPTPGPRTPGVYGGGDTPGSKKANSSKVRMSVSPPSGSDSSCNPIKLPRRVASVVVIDGTPSDPPPDDCAGAGTVVVVTLAGRNVMSGGLSGVITLSGTSKWITVPSE